MDKDSEVTSDKYTDYLEADLKKAGTYVKYSLISGYHDFGLWFLSSENRKKHYAESDKIQENFKNDLKAIDKELEEALDKERKAKELLPKVYMVLSKTKNPNARKSFEAYFNYLKKQSDTDDTFLYNASKSAGIGLIQGTTEYYAAEAVGGTTVSLIGVSMLFRGDTRIETPKENEKNSYIPKENRITIAYSDALKLKKHFTDYYSDRIGYYNILGLVENDGIPRNTSTLENDPRISEDIARYYNGERSKLENKGYVVGNIVGNIAGYKLASEGAFYKNNSTEASSNKFVETQKYSLSNVEARKWYLEQEAKIPGMIDSSLSLEEQAKQAFNLRNKFRTEARELMADRATAESLYKTDPNWSWEKIVQKQVEKGLSGDDIYKEIIASSQRSRDAVNKSLGVK